VQAQSGDRSGLLEVAVTNAGDIHATAQIAIVELSIPATELLASAKILPREDGWRTKALRSSSPNDGTRLFMASRSECRRREHVRCPPAVESVSAQRNRVQETIPGSKIARLPPLMRSKTNHRELIQIAPAT